MSAAARKSVAAISTLNVSWSINDNRTTFYFNIGIRDGISNAKRFLKTVS
jgi:hypothetical protein